MSDLISRSALIKDADKHFGHPNAFYSNESFKELIGNQPTAYNVDKVVEKLEECRQKYQRLCKEQGESEDEAMNIIFRGAIKIVKVGVVE